jgi:hypothetical protein
VAQGYGSNKERSYASTIDEGDTRMSLIVSAATRAVCGLALSCSNKTPVLSSPRRFDLMAGRSHMIRYEVVIRGTGDCSFLRRVLFYK